MGVVVANVVIDEAKKKQKSLFLFKIDFEKAYDTVDWRFLMDMLKVMGFGVQNGVVGSWNVYLRQNPRY